MKKIRLGLIALTAIILIILSSGTAKAETWEKFLEGTMWRFQNPQISTWCVIWGFGENKTFSSAIKDMNTGADGGGLGTFSLSNNTIKITINNTETIYTLNFVNKDKIEIRGDGIYLILARIGSSEDTWFNNMIQKQNNVMTTPTPITTTHKACYTCYGGGGCKVCGGSGIYSLLGHSRTCSACSGTGKCWHCHGSGKQ